MDHSHDHAHDHHGHGHSHSHHDHSHDHSNGDGEYYLNQLLLVFICGAFGVVAVLLYQTLDAATGRGMLDKLLAPRFQLPVLLGGAGLLVMVVIRGVCLWQSAGAAHDHHDHSHHDHKPGEPCDHPSHHVGHDHKPGEKCDHPSHAHDDHDHGDHSAEDHDHGNVYWRVVVLAFPIFLFAMGVPSKGFSVRWLKEYLGEEEALKYSNLDVEKKAGVSALFSFKQLNDEARNESNRKALIGTPVQLRGQFAPVGPKEFSLVFLNQTCCAADNEPLRARIVVSGASEMPAVPQYAWVTVDGVIADFAQTTKGEWVTIIRSNAGGVKATDQVR